MSESPDHNNDIVSPSGEHSALAKGQHDFMEALTKGPDHLPEDLFSGSPYRAFVGVKAHANTISHARLIALEDSYPKLRSRLGDERFNVLSREFLETHAVRGRDINGLGQGFAEFIALHGEDRASVDLAHIEWAWLQSFNAEEAVPLTMQDIATLDEDQLMALPLHFHPSVRHIVLGAPLAPELGLDAVDDQEITAIAVARPESEVLLFPQDIVQKEIFMACDESILMRNLLEHGIETIGEERALEHVFALVGAMLLVQSK